MRGEEEERLVEENSRLVWSIVRRYIAYGEGEDLFQLGCIGLVKAARSFDPGLGYAFSTFAVPHIAGEIKRSLRRDGGVKVSRELRELSRRAAAVRERLCAETGEEPRLSRVAEVLGVPPEELAAAETAALPLRSMEEELPDGRRLGEMLPAPGEEEPMLERMALRNALANLPAADAALVRLRFFTGLSQMQTAGVLGLSQSKVSRWERSILRSLRQKIG